MSKTYARPTADEMTRQHNTYWEDALAGLDTPVLEESPAAYVMPYFSAFRTYEKHVAGCETCQTTPVWDIGCTEGARLAHESADAMAMQERLGGLN